MHAAVIDIGSPKKKNLGWAISGPTRCQGTDLDQCVGVLASALDAGPLALGFEAPMFVPCHQSPSDLTKARQGECVGGINRAFSAGAGSAVLVTGLVVVPYLLTKLRARVPGATATLDWRAPPTERKHLLLFEAFVTNQKKTGDSRHVEDARRAVEAFQDGMRDPAQLKSAVVVDSCFSLIGAMLLRTGWTHDLAILHEPCLVVRA